MITNVADDGVLGEPLEVLSPDDVLAPSGGDDDLSDVGDVVERVHLVSWKKNSSQFFS